MLLMGDYVIAPQMLVLSGVAKDILHPKDYASDLTVLSSTH